MSDRIEKVAGKGGGRRVVVGAIAAVLLVAAAPIGLRLAQDRGGEGPVAATLPANPSGTPALAPLTADRERIPNALEAAARRSLTANGRADLGSAKVVSLNAGLQEVPLQSATSAYILFGDESKRSWKVFVGTSDGGSPSRNLCDLALPAVLECDVRTTTDGRVVVSSIVALERQSELGPDKYALLAHKPTSDNLQNYRFERNVRVFHKNGSMTSVTETLVAPNSLEFSSVFETPVEALAETAESPELVWK